MIAHVYFCAAVKNRWSNLVRLVHSFAAQQDVNSTLCIYDWNSADHEPIRSQEDFYGATASPAIGHYRYRFEANKNSFNRSASRNIAFKMTNAKDDDIVFFIDCDMTIPQSMSTRLRDIIKPGVAYFPVAYSLYEDCQPVVNGDGPEHKRGNSSANGWWRTAGFGNCGFVVRDFLDIGQWDERFGDKYGGDDNDIRWRAEQKLKIVRENLDGFFHFWHPPAIAQRNPRLRDIPWHPLYHTYD